MDSVDVVLPLLALVEQGKTWVVAVALLVMLTVQGVALFFAKKLGDEMATWVHAHDEREHDAEFGLSFKRGKSALRRYHHYKGRYVELRKARNESTAKATWFTVLEASIFVALLACIAFGATLDPRR